MDADGYFYLYCAKGSVKFSFSLVQKMVNKRTNLSFKPCFEEIANTFDFKLSVIKNWSFLFYFKGRRFNRRRKRKNKKSKMNNKRKDFDWTHLNDL